MDVGSVGHTAGGCWPVGAISMDWKAGQMQTVPSIQRKKRKYNSQMQKQTAQNKEGVCAEYNIAQSAFSYRGNRVIEGLHSPFLSAKMTPI